ncbi:MAG: type IV toxin-antitoxin system AbiEi family antitoxin domain-containing protein [Solirubrobacterales bacterium]
MAAETAILPSPNALSRSRAIDSAITRIAAAQRGRVARAQLIAAGIGRGAIANRTASGMLAPLYPGVYAVGHLSREPLADLWAARLFVGADAVFSHEVAGQLRGIQARGTAPITLTTPRKLASRPGLRIHHSLLPADEVSLLDGLPVTVVSRTLLDLAGVLTPRRLQRALEECERLWIGGGLGVEALLGRYPGRRGAGTLRRALATWSPGASWTRSELEERFICFLDGQGLPRGETNARVQTAQESFECDVVWSQQRLIVERDGLSVHRGDLAFERDTAKRRALSAAGWTVVVITWRALHEQSEALAAELAALLR